MAESPRENQLLVWSLGTFHSGFFVLVLVAVVYRAGSLGDLLRGLNTLLGLGIFGLLWMVTYWSTRRALRGVNWSTLDADDAGELLRRGLGWGGATGVLFLLGVAAVVLLVAILSALAALLAGVSEPGPMVQALPFIVLAGVFYIAIASVVAFLIGALVGAAFALLDILVLLTRERLLTLRNSEAAIRSSDDDHGRIPHHTYDAERN